MRNLYRIAFLLSLLFITGIMSASAQVPPPSSDSHMAGYKRADLLPTDELWSYVRDKVGYSGKPLGFTVDEMANFRGTTCKLSIIESLFRDVRSIPRYTGRVGDVLLDKPDDFANAGLTAFSMLEATGGRLMEPLKMVDWGVDWIQVSDSSDKALELILDKTMKEGVRSPMTSEARAEWSKLPEETKRFAVRMILASMQGSDNIRQSWDQNFLKSYFKVDDIKDIPREKLYEFAMWPWIDQTPIPVPRESFDMLTKFDKLYLGYGSVTYFNLAKAAIDEYKAAPVKVPAGVKHFEFETTEGNVGFYGPGRDEISGTHALVIDLGGDDSYTGSTAINESIVKPIGVVVDLGGDDSYDSGDYAGALACGAFGLGAIFDMSGNDTYKCKESGIGTGLYGAGMVVDYDGDDTYTSYSFSQASAHAGIGVLIDLGGDDKYNCVEYSQAFGSTLGAGLLVDVSGNDVYYADPRGNVSELFEGRTCNFAQGTGYGRRADLGDGHSLGGGVGILVEGAGDDSYTGSVYSQGAGYWWALGGVEDRGGNDTVFNEQYSCGSAPHFAIGCYVDFSGDDKYNIGNDTLARQVQGCARDGSIGIFIDGSGNDQYFHRNLCAGSSDLNCITLFWDRMGDNIYTADRSPAQQWPWSYGDCVLYDLFYAYRDDMPAVGIFLDTAGTDKYVEIMPTDPAVAATCTPLPFGENKEWQQRNDARFRGFGCDTNWFTGIKEEPAPAPAS